MQNIGNIGNAAYIAAVQRTKEERQKIFNETIIGKIANDYGAIVRTKTIADIEADPTLSEKNAIYNETSSCFQRYCEFCGGFGHTWKSDVNYGKCPMMVYINAKLTNTAHVEYGKAKTKY